MRASAETRLWQPHARSGRLAAEFAARDVLVIAGAVIAVAALLISALIVRDTAALVALRCTRRGLQVARRASLT